jgi:hypothetical protein
MSLQATSLLLAKGADPEYITADGVSALDQAQTMVTSPLSFKAAFYLFEATCTTRESSAQRKR